MRSCPQFLDLFFEFRNLLLLLFDRVEHRPEDRIVVDHQIAVRILADRFRDDLLQGLGAKTDLFERRAQLNVALFDYEYKNIQAVEYPLGVEIIRNAAKARLYGIDVDSKALLSEGLSVTLGFEYLHDRFTSFPNAVYGIPLQGGGTGFTFGSATGHRSSIAARI